MTASSKSENLVVRPDCSIKDAMAAMVENTEKTIFVADQDRRFLGVVSDGDLRRHILKTGELSGDIRNCINKNAIVLSQGADRKAAAALMLEHRIDAIPIVDGNGKLVDAIFWDDAHTTKTETFGRIDCPVVIMAGGRGTRLDPFTRILPKPLIPIGDQPIIEIIMEKIARHGTSRFHVSVNHQAHVMKAYLREKPHEFAIEFIEEDEPLGTAGCLSLFEPEQPGSVLVTNCDIIIDHPIDEIVKFHEESGAAITIVGAMYQMTVPYGTCAIGPGGVLTSIQEKPSQEYLVNTGMYVVHSDVLDLIPKNQLYNFTDLIQDAKDAGKKVVVFPIDSRAWTDVGQWTEYHKAVNALS